METATNGPVKGKASKTSYRAGTEDQPLTHYHSLFSSLLNWENPRVSAIAYVSIASLIFAVRYLDLIRYGLKMTWIALGSTVLAELVGKGIMGQGLVTSMRPRKYITISEDTLASIIGDVHELFNFFAIEFQRILFVENVCATVGAFFAALISYYLVKVVPYWGLALIGVTAAFFLPLVYTSNQELIDSHIKQAGDILDAQTRQLREVAEKHTAQAAEMGKQYLGDYTSKAQAMLQGRSASPETLSKPTANKDYKNSDFPDVPKNAPGLAKDESEAGKEEEPLFG